MPLAPSSYHTVHGTVSLGPVKAMSGTSLFRVGSMFSVGSPAAAWRRGAQPLEPGLLEAEAVDGRPAARGDTGAAGGAGDAP